jgi:hypothetical protein
MRARQYHINKGWLPSDEPAFRGSTYVADGRMTICDVCGTTFFIQHTPGATKEYSWSHPGEAWSSHNPFEAEADGWFSQHCEFLHKWLAPVRPATYPEQEAMKKVMAICGL